jgi:hypothetical protein
VSAKKAVELQDKQLVVQRKAEYSGKSVSDGGAATGGESCAAIGGASNAVTE